jgi:glyoxylase-like metal-dependent hydrolase (beta-lactamase superfamily II)
MRKILATITVTIVSMVVSAQEGKVTLAQVANAMGATNLNTIEYRGNGYTYGIGQQGAPFAPWPRFKAAYAVQIDFKAPAVRRQIVRRQSENPPSGGAGQPMNGSQRQEQVVGGSPGWLVAPHGLIKAAIASNNARTSGKTITFTLDGQDIKLTLNNENLVERAEYKTDNNVLGDVMVETTYSNYADFSGIKFPRRIVETTDGFPSLNVTIRDVKPNAPVAVEVRAPAAPTAPKVDAEKVADGVWYLNMFNYHSIAVEFKDHVVMFEGPVSDARTQAVNDWVKQTLPSKPIKYLVVTHHHFDHLGGVRGYVAAGIPVITHAMEVPYLERVVARPHTVKPDLLSKAPRAGVFEPMTEKKVLSDDTRTMELYNIQGSGHSPWLLIGYLPKEKMVLEADVYNPVGNDPRDPTLTSDYWQNFVDNVRRLKIDVTQLLPIHGRVVPFEDVTKAIQEAAGAKPNAGS